VLPVVHSKSELAQDVKDSWEKEQKHTSIEQIPVILYYNL